MEEGSKLGVCFLCGEKNDGKNEKKSFFCSSCRKEGRREAKVINLVLELYGENEEKWKKTRKKTKRKKEKRKIVFFLPGKRNYFPQEEEEEVKKWAKETKKYSPLGKNANGREILNTFSRMFSDGRKRGRKHVLNLVFVLFYGFVFVLFAFVFVLFLFLWSFLIFVLIFSFWSLFLSLFFSFLHFLFVVLFFSHFISFRSFLIHILTSLGVFRFSFFSSVFFVVFLTFFFVLLLS